MKLLRKLTVTASLAFLLGSSNLVASSSTTYTVQSGDTLLAIVYKLGFSSIEAAGFEAPSGDIHKIYPGDVLGYAGHKKKKKNKFVSKAKIDLKKFCFKDNRSIHYKSNERCKH